MPFFVRRISARYSLERNPAHPDPDTRRSFLRSVGTQRLLRNARKLLGIFIAPAFRRWCVSQSYCLGTIHWTKVDSEEDGEIHFTLYEARIVRVPASSYLGLYEMISQIYISELVMNCQLFTAVFSRLFDQSL